MQPLRAHNTVGYEINASCVGLHGQRAIRHSRPLLRGSTPKAPKAGTTNRAIYVSTASTTKSDLIPSDALEHGQHSNKFIWEKNWYAVTPISVVDVTKPYPFSLLGRDFVLWKDAKGEWHAFEDRCPHRGAALSSGTVSEKGTLVCPLHGWTFNGEGVCERLPQADDPNMLVESPRARPMHFPVKVVNGLLWLWPQSGPDAWIDSAMQEPYIIEQSSMMDAEEGVSGWTFGDGPVGYISTVESALDPAHVPFVHSGIFGKPGTDVPFKMKLQGFSADGFSFTHGGFMESNQGMKATRAFIPPCTTTAEYEYANGGTMWTQLNIVPTRPGWCRYTGIVQFKIPGVDASSSIPLRLFKRMAPSMYIAYMHSTTHAFNDQDTRVLPRLDNVMNGREGQWRNQYYMPTTADVGVTAFRNWLERFGGGNVPWDEGAPEFKPANQEQLWDRWHRHTKNCVHCKSAYKTIRSVQGALNSVSLWLFLASAALCVSRLFGLGAWTTGAAVGGVILAGLCLLAMNVLDDWAFRFVSSVPWKGVPGEPKFYD